MGSNRHLQLHNHHSHNIINHHHSINQMMVVTGTRKHQ